jgi:formylglycine-generating enzyme required for sulfatase activity
LVLFKKVSPLVLFKKVSPLREVKPFVREKVSPFAKVKPFIPDKGEIFCCCGKAKTPQHLKNIPYFWKAFKSSFKSSFMKKILLFLLMLSLFPLTNAQETKEMKIVGKPKKLDTGEMVARRDGNGNYCAAIQVISNLDGFSYDSFDGMVGSIDDNPGMDMVYLTSTERVLQVFKSGYKPLKIILSEFGITLKTREVWQIEIAGDELAVVLPVTFRFTPADATLLIDGKPAGTSATQNLALGKHTIKLVKDSYQTIEKDITVDDKNVFFEWKMLKQPDVALQIETIPEGATVYLEGVKLGESPVAAFYKPGTYPIRITKEGYVSIENQNLEVTLPQTRKSYTLEENVGYLTVNTNPGATVYFNEEKITNPKNVKLAPQLVKIKVTMPKAETLEQQVVLKRNDKLVLEMFPDVQTGSLQIAVTPFDAKIELTGDAGEKYTSEGMKVFKDIPVGTYTIKVTAAGYTNATETASIKQAETNKKTINLSKQNSANNTGSATTTSADDIEMVFVKGGTFTMGSNDGESDEKPTHQVTLSDFYMGKYEITQKQWRDVMGASTSLSDPSYFKNCDNCPVEQASWNDVQEFIKKLNQKTGKTYRLPTEAEWEYAARGSSTGSATTYAGSNNIDEVAWYTSNSGSKTHPVGQKKPNALGIYDMSGNVWEWCSDLYGNYSGGSQTNPQGATSGSIRVLRGGSWRNYASRCRVSSRYYFFGNGDCNYGFRLALVP